MALLDEKDLAGEAAKRARFRVHHVGTKLNQAELHELEALAAKRKQTQGELMRGLVLREIEQDKTGLRPSAEMVEITACRLLLVNLLGPLAKGEAMTQERFDGIVDEVKRQKARVARDRLKDHEARR
jgi:hypothetical protein